MDISRRLPESPLDISRRLPEPPPSLSLDVITIYITLEPSQSNPTLVCLQHRRDIECPNFNYGRRVFHPEWPGDVKQLEREWAAKQARMREVEDAMMFL